MSRYLIKQDNPFTHKDQILKFWEEFLPDTPSQRLEWMMNGNPAGPATWYFAFEQSSGELSGMISLMPRELMASERKIRAGIMGDFVVGKKHRVFGPALSLVKEALAAMDSMNLSLIYSIPNTDSEKLLERAGLIRIGKFLHLVRPIKLNHYKKKYANRLLSVIPLYAAEFFLKIISRDTYSADSNIQEQKSISEEFNNLWNQYRLNPEGITGVRDPAYIQWKFFDNPIANFHMIACRDRKTYHLSGYLAYTITDNRMHIYDVFSIKETAVYGLLKEVTKIAKKNDCIAIYVRLSETTPLIRVFKKCNYLDARDNAPIYVQYKKKELDLDHWEFYSGDRNI
jgi:hypothetical protein